MEGNKPMNGKIETRTHLSPTQVNMFLRCPAQWYYRYVRGLKRPPSGAATLGSAVDTGITHNYLQKIETHQDLVLDEVLDAFSTGFEARKTETLWEAEEEPNKVKDDGVRVLSLYHKEAAPKVQPTSVQERVELEIPNFSYRFVAVPDVIEHERVIRDTKVVKRSPARNNEAFVATPTHQDQMVAYALAYRVTQGRAEKSCFVDYLVRTKTSKLVQVPFQVTSTHLTYYKNLIGLVAKQIEAQIFTPNRQHHLCSRRYCGYWEECEKDFGGVVRS
jgi:CRISPR/Cas system-associated exonuclease Cas4 (RecB family)